MANFVHEKQLELDETDDDKMKQNELQVIDALVIAKEDKGKQPIVVTSIEAHIDDLAMR